MGMDMFKKIIDQIYANKPMIKLFMSGEPLLNEDLCEMIEYAKSKGCQTVVHTNATLLTNEAAVRILNSKLDRISFSFDGCTPEIYEKLRPPANFRKVKSQIENFLRLRREMGAKLPYTVVECIRMKETEKYLPDFIDSWKKSGVDEVNVAACMTWLDSVDEHRVEVPSNLGYKPCVSLFNSCAILSDGTVVPCCMDVNGKLPLGDITRQPFDDIWYGKQYNLLRIQHLEGNIQKNSICCGCYNTWIQSRREQLELFALNASGIIKSSRDEIKIG